MPTLHLEDIHLTRGRTTVFEGLSLVLSEPRIGLIGHNGAGKTSLLRLLCGLEVPTRGTVRITADPPKTHANANANANPNSSSRAPASAPAPGPAVGMMFQNPDDQIIFPTVVEELALGRQPRGLKKREALQQARAFLAERGLEPWADRAISSLSQGQRQHVCWLSLLLAGPATRLLDEPYASLDLPGQARLCRDLARTDRQLIVSTHLLDHVRPWPRVLWIDEGRVRADGDGASVCAAYEAHVQTLIAGQFPDGMPGSEKTADASHTAPSGTSGHTVPSSTTACTARRNATGHTAPLDITGQAGQPHG